MESPEKIPSGRREARKQDRRSAILAVAKRCFLDNGYAATSMSAIAVEIGGSKATLWNYFPSKEELFSAVLDEATADYRQRLVDVLQPSGDLREALRDFCRSFLTKITSCDALRLHRLIAAEAVRFPEVGKIFYERGPKLKDQMLSAFLADRMAAGQLRQADPMRAARALSSLCAGGLQQRLLWGVIDQVTPAEIEMEAQAAADLFLRAFACETKPVLGG